MVYNRAAKRRFIIKSRRHSRLRALLVALFAVALIALTLSIMSKARLTNSVSNLVPCVPVVNALLS